METKKMAKWNEVSQGKIVKLDEDNPSVEGTFTQIREGQYGPLYDIQQANGETITLPSDTVLQTKLTKNLIGKEIKVEFVGLEKSTKRKGKDYKNYKVFTKG